MDTATGFIGSEDAFGVQNQIFGDEFEVVFGGKRGGELLELGKRKSGIEEGFFDVEAGKLETDFDGVAEDEAGENGRSGDGISREVSGDVDAVYGDGLGDIGIRESLSGNMNDFIGVNGV